MRLIFAFRRFFWVASAFFSILNLLQFKIAPSLEIQIERHSPPRAYEQGERSRGGAQLFPNKVFHIYPSRGGGTSLEKRNEC